MLHGRGGSSEKLFFIIGFLRIIQDSKDLPPRQPKAAATPPKQGGEFDLIKSQQNLGLHLSR